MNIKFNITFNTNAIIEEIRWYLCSQTAFNVCENVEYKLIINTEIDKLIKMRYQLENSDQYKKSIICWE